MILILWKTLAFFYLLLAVNYIILVIKTFRDKKKLFWNIGSLLLSLMLLLDSLFNIYSIINLNIEHITLISYFVTIFVTYFLLSTRGVYRFMYKED